MAISKRVPVPRWKREAELVLGRGVNSYSQSRRELPVDKVMLAVVLGITLFGAVMVYSASAILAEKNYGSQFYFLSRQALWALAGFGAMAVGLAIDYRHYTRPVVIYSALVVTFVLLVVVLFLPRVNETHRWIRYGAFSLQPSEPAKLALIAFLGFFLERRMREIESFKGTFVRAAVVAGALIGLSGRTRSGHPMASDWFYHDDVPAGTPVRYFALAVPVLPAITYMP
jgi:cell division protein FtsW (lipid II flippase)